jgi:hypothetical protein
VTRSADSGKRMTVTPLDAGRNVSDGAIFFEPFGSVQAW